MSPFAASVFAASVTVASPSPTAWPGAPGAPLDGFVAVALLLVLAAREVTLTSGRTLRLLARGLSWAVVPLLLGFAFAVAGRLATLR